MAEETYTQTRSGFVLGASNGEWIGLLGSKFGSCGKSLARAHLFQTRSAALDVARFGRLGDVSVYPATALESVTITVTR